MKGIYWAIRRWIRRLCGIKEIPLTNEMITREAVKIFSEGAGRK